MTMNRDDDRHEQKIEDYWHYRYRDWDRADDTEAAELKLKILHSRLGIGGRQPDEALDDGPAESNPDVTVASLLEEKAKLLKKIAATFEVGEQDELYRLLDNIRLSDPTAGTELDQLLHLLAKRIPIQPADNRPSGRSRRLAEGEFNILEILAGQARQEERQKLEALRVDIAYLRSEWRLYRSGSSR